MNSGRTKQFIKLTATVEINGQIFALTSRWYSNLRNFIKIGVIKSSLSSERNGEEYLKTLSENPL